MRCSQEKAGISQSVVAAVAAAERHAEEYRTSEEARRYPIHARDGVAWAEDAKQFLREMERPGSSPGRRRWAAERAMHAASHAVYGCSCVRAYSSDDPEGDEPGHQARLVGGRR
jgi:hypothetical protein